MRAHTDGDRYLCLTQPWNGIELKLVQFQMAFRLPNKRDSNHFWTLGWEKTSSEIYPGWREVWWQSNLNQSKSFIKKLLPSLRIISVYMWHACGETQRLYFLFPFQINSRRAIWRRSWAISNLSHYSQMCILHGSHQLLGGSTTCNQF